MNDTASSQEDLSLNASGEVQSPLGVAEGRIFDVLAKTSKNYYYYVCNVRDDISRWSRNAVEEFGLPGEYMRHAGDIWLGHIHPDDREAYEEDIRQIMSGRKSFHDCEYRARDRNGNYVLCNCKGFLQKGTGGEPDIFAGSIINLGIIDTLDPVTRLGNATAFLNAVSSRLQCGAPSSVLALRIDNFEQVNGRFGYTSGSEILRSFAEKIDGHVKSFASVYRLDGIKFVLLMGASDRAFLQKCCDELQGLARRGVMHQGVQMHLMLSFAAMPIPGDLADETTIPSELSLALSISRREHDGEPIFLDPAQEAFAKKLVFASKLKNAVLDGCHGFKMVYQPKISIEGKPIGVEALLRWKDERGSLTTPAFFLPLLENDRCFYELGLWILRTSLEEMSAFLKEFPRLTVSVNVSYRQLEHESFYVDVMNVVQETGFPKDNLILELTEHSRTSFSNRVKCNLEYLHNCSIRLSSDDFGTGFSTLALLRDLPFDEIKIDQSFIQGLRPGSKDCYIIESIIACANGLGLHTCIEGVEDDSVLRNVHSFGATSYQGYLFSRPVPMENLLDALRSRQCNPEKMPGQPNRGRRPARQTEAPDTAPETASSLYSVFRNALHGTVPFPGSKKKAEPCGPDSADAPAGSEGQEAHGLAERIGKLLFTGGMDKEQYRLLQPLVCENNFKSIRMFTLVSAAAFVLMMLASFLLPRISHNLPAYAMLGISSLAFGTVSRLNTLAFSRVNLPLMYAFVSSMFAYAIYIGTYGNPTEGCAVYVAFLLGMPLVFIDRPIREIAFTLATLGVYFLVASCAKGGDPGLQNDLINAGIFALVNCVLCVLFIKVKLERIYFEHRTLVLSETDILTGLQNRNRYEKNIGGYPERCLSHAACIFVDVNGLHEMNNRYGHEAGDTMLKKTAECLRNAFGEADCYRIGGDEFVVFSLDSGEASVAEAINEVRKKLGESSYHISVGVARAEKKNLVMTALINQAETSMRQDKQAYYSSQKHDSRGSR